VEDGPAHEHAGAAHAEVLVPVERELPLLAAPAPARLAHKVQLRAVDAAEEVEQLVPAHKDVVVRAHKPVGSRTKKAYITLLYFLLLWA
jgi:hypothetical protein